MTYNVQYTCRITYGKFSYFLPPEWVYTTDPDAVDALRLSVEKRWSIVKACDVTIDHFRVMSVRQSPR